MKFKTSSIPKKSSGMSQLMSCDSMCQHVRVVCMCVCVCVCVTSLLSLALTPNRPSHPPSPSTIPRVRLNEIWHAKTITEESNY